MTNNLAESLDDSLDESDGLGDEILDALLVEADELAEQPKPKFVIDSIRGADWAVRRILKLQARDEKIDQFAEQRIKQIEAWQEKVKSENEKSISFLSELLRPYAEQFVTKKKKTVKFPSGNVSFRQASIQYFIAGQKADGKNKQLTEYVKNNAPDFLKIEESTKWGEFKETLQLIDTGQVVSTDGEVIDFMLGAKFPDTISVKAIKERCDDEQPVFSQGEPNSYGLTEVGYKRHGK